ncbi:MAG: signal peptide peptidase SppA [Pseudomonadota bacterium]
MDPVTRDFYEERRRSWRRSAFWRGFLVAAVILGLIAAAVGFSGGPPSGQHIARLYVTDIIFSDRARTRLIGEISESDAARALIVHIDSPGGTVVGSEELYLALRDVAQEKPVVAVLNGVAASGGYIAALGADHVVARGNTITGSIGVIFEYLTFTGLMERLGVDVETIRSSDLKAAASPYRDLSPEARAAERDMVEETFRWFRDLVGERRDLAGAELAAVTDGRTFTGRMALESGLVDALGGEEVSLSHLESLDSSLTDLPVETWQVERDDEGVFGFFGKLGVFGAGFPTLRVPEGPRLMAILN